MSISQDGHWLFNDGADLTSGELTGISSFQLVTGAANGYVLQCDATGTATWSASSSAGEANTASNVGTAGVSVFKQKTGVDFEFKNINAGSNKVTITDDTGNNEIDIDVVESNIIIGNLSGAPTSTVVGITDTQTLTNKTIVSANNTLTIPLNDLSNVSVAAPVNQDVLYYNGAGSWIAQAIPKIEIYKVSDVKSSGTNGGTFSNGDWRTHDLNTLTSLNGTSCSVASDQFTLTAGSYSIDARAVVYRTNATIARIQNITDSTTVDTGLTIYARNQTNGDGYVSSVSTTLVIVSTKTFEFQLRGSNTNSNNGFGRSAGFDGISETYASIMITKIP
jgi:hypothetical protein